MMRASLGPLSLLLTVLSSAALSGCGGGVIGVQAPGDDGGPKGGPGIDGGGNDDGGGYVNPACPEAFRVGNGQTCSLSGLTCPSGIGVTDCAGNVRALDCFCDGAAWTCERAVAPNCSTGGCPPPSAIVSGAACEGSLGEQCTADVSTMGCGGPPSFIQATCTCTAKGWACPQQFAPPCDPPPSCPPPPVIYPAGACQGLIGLQCMSSTLSGGCGYPPMSFPTPCICTPSGWSCKGPGPQCPPPPPPPTCPPPSKIYAYNPCYGQGLSCPGNPQVCQGETFYDTFECAGEWIPIATTVCSHSGPVDAGVSDAALHD